MMTITRYEARAIAAALFDGGWRPGDLDLFTEDYARQDHDARLTPDDIGAIFGALAELAAEPV